MRASDTGHRRVGSVLENETSHPQDHTGRRDGLTHRDGVWMCVHMCICACVHRSIHVNLSTCTRGECVSVDLCICPYVCTEWCVCVYEVNSSTSG